MHRLKKLLFGLVVVGVAWVVTEINLVDSHLLKISFAIVSSWLILRTYHWSSGDVNER